MKASLGGSSDSEESVDLSWLPDPDRKRDIDEMVQEDDEKVPVKRKKLVADEETALKLLESI